ncbi:MAG: anion permease, partial [Myxococcales bacterium]|nr:anion permease [Myxococcales bacterium]
HALLGVALGAAVMLGPLRGHDPAVGRTAAIAVLMATWWVLEVVPLYVTALLPLVLFPLAGVDTLPGVAVAYGNPTIFLFLGGFILALGLQRSGLHRRVALAIVATIGSRPGRLVLGFMLASALLSMWISNTAAVLVLMPIALSVLDEAREHGVEGDDLGPLGTAMMLGIAYAADIGGMATPIGTPPNLVLIELLPRIFPGAPPLDFGSWMAMGLPMSALFLLGGYHLLSRRLFRLREGPLLAGSDVLRRAQRALGPARRDEWWSGGVFVATALLWMTGSGLRLGTWLTLPGWRSLPGLAEVGDASVAVAGAVAVMGAGIAIGLAPAQLQRERPCAHVADGVDEVWTRQAPAQIARAFEATELPHASQAAADVQRTLDAYAEQWRAAREAACTATLVDGTQSGATMDLRVACLEPRRLHLAALVEAFEDADAAVVDNAAVAARSLPRITDCDDERVLAQLPPTPSDPAQRERVDRLRERLAALTAARRAGQLKAALTLGQELRGPVAALGYAPVEAELELELGMIHAALGHHAQAEEHLRATLVAAARGRYEQVRGDAWLELARELGVGQKRFEAGEEAARAAEASLAGRGEDPATSERLLLVQADLALARDDVRRAEALLRDLLSRDDVVTERHELLAQLGTVAESSFDAAQLLREALQLRREALGPRHPRVADVQLALSKRLADHAKYDEAMAMAVQAHEIRRPLFEHDSVAVAATISAQAYVEARRGRTAEATRLFERAVEMIRNDPDHVEFDLATMLSNIGVMYSRLGRQAEARQLYEQVIEIYERTDPEHPRLLLPLLNMAAAYIREGATEPAIEWSERAVARMLLDARSTYPLVQVELDVAELYMDAGRLEPARAYLERAERRLEELEGDRQSRRFHRSLGVRARLQLLEGRPDAAAGSAAESIRRYEQDVLSARDGPDLAQIRFVYAQALLAQGHRDEAIAQAHAAVPGLAGPLLERARTQVET